MISRYLFTWKKFLDPWWSPPSAWIGSTRIPATGQPILVWFWMWSSTLAKHRSSSALFSRACSSSGYLYLGNSALGHFNWGMSTPCKGLERIEPPCRLGSVIRLGYFWKILAKMHSKVTKMYGDFFKNGNLYKMCQSIFKKLPRQKFKYKIKNN